MQHTYEAKARYEYEIEQVHLRYPTDLILIQNVYKSDKDKLGESHEYSIKKLREGIKEKVILEEYNKPPAPPPPPVAPPPPPPPATIKASTVLKVISSNTLDRTALVVVLI